MFVTLSVPAAPNKPNIPLKADRPATIDDIVTPDISFGNCAVQFDPRYPLREYEFVELFVRCAIRSRMNLQLIRADPSFEEASPVDVVDEKGKMITGTMNQTQGALGSTMNRLRTGTVKSKNGIDIADLVYGTLAEQLHAVSADLTLVPELVCAFYSSAVQDMFKKRSSVLTEIYMAIGSENPSKPPTLKNILNYFLTLRRPSDDFFRPSIASSCTLMQLLKVTSESLIDEVRNLCSG